MRKLSNAKTKKQSHLELLTNLFHFKAFLFTFTTTAGGNLDLFIINFHGLSFYYLIMKQIISCRMGIYNSFRFLFSILVKSFFVFGIIKWQIPTSLYFWFCGKLSQWTINFNYTSWNKWKFGIEFVVLEMKLFEMFDSFELKPWLLKIKEFQNLHHNFTLIFVY